MRKPSENGLASTNTPRACSIAKVSRALWPSASTTWSARSSSPSARVTPRRWRTPSASISTSTSSTRLPKRTSPPSDSMVARMCSTIDTSRKVPMCGLLTYRISSGAPAATNSSSTLRPWCCLSLIWLYSLPSENVPAPPSPNCTLDSGSSTLRRHRPKVSTVRSRTALPRSRMIGLKPICASTSPANRPQGPMPTTSGRSGNRAGACATNL